MPLSSSSSSSTPDGWPCGEGWGSGGGARRWCNGWRIVAPHLLVEAVQSRHLLFYGLYLLHPLLFIFLVVLIQLYVPPVGLLKLLMRWLIQCMDLIMDELQISPDKPSSKYRAWRIWPTVRDPHPLNPPLVAVADRLNPYLIVANKCANRSAPTATVSIGP